MKPMKPSNAIIIYQMVLQLVVSICMILALLLMLSVAMPYLPIPKEYINYFPVLLITAVTMFYLFEHKHGGTLAFRKSYAGKNCTVGFAIGIVLISIVSIVLLIIHHIVITKLRPDAWPYFLLFLFLFAIVALQEELLSRGYIYGMIRRHYNMWIAIIFSSLLFSLMHFGNPNFLSSPLPPLNIILAGMFLGIVREYTDSIWMPVGIHWSWNLFQGNVFGFSVSGKSMTSFLSIKTVGSPWLTGGKFGVEGSILTTILFIAAIWIVHKHYTKKTSASIKIPVR